MAPALELYFEGRTLMTSWPNPSDYVCRVFVCNNLPRTEMIGWIDLPLNKVATFYETDDCTYSTRSFTFNTGSVRTQLTGMHILDPPRMIRSMMLGRNEAALLDEKLSIHKPTSASKKTPKPATSSKKTPKPATSDKKTPKPTSKATQPPTTDKKKKISKGTCTAVKKKHESFFNGTKANSSYAIEWHSDEGSIGGLSSNWSAALH